MAHMKVIRILPRHTTILMSAAGGQALATANISRSLLIKQDRRANVGTLAGHMWMSSANKWGYKYGVPAGVSFNYPPTLLDTRCMGMLGRHRHQVSYGNPEFRT